MRVTKRVRRWHRSTPNAQVATTMMGLGCVLVLVALVILGVHNGWF